MTALWHYISEVNGVRTCVFSWCYTWYLPGSVVFWCYWNVDAVVSDLRQKKRSITEYLLLLLQTKINILVSTHWVALPRIFLVNVHLWETKWKNWDWRVEEGGEFLGYLAIACVLRGRSLYLNSLVVCVVFWVFFGIFLPFIMAPRHKLDSSHFQNETDFNRAVGLNGVVNFKAALVTICCRCWKKTHRLIQIWLQFHFPC